MSFADDYIVNPLKYSLSNIKALLIFTALGFIPLVLLLVIVLTTGISILSKYGSDMGSMTPETTFSLIMALGIGFIIWLVISILISLATNGYIVKLIKTSIAGEQVLPNWEKWGDLLSKGLILTIGSIIMSLIFLAIHTLVSMPFNYLEIPVIAGILTTIINIFQMLYIPLAVSNYSYTEEFTAFFKVKEICKMMSLKWLAILIVVSIISLIVLIPTFLLGMGFILSLVGGSFEMGAIVGIITVLVASLSYSIISFYAYRCYATYYKSVITDSFDTVIIEEEITEDFE
ncbi:DUF4013 domain-containing protein [Methanococcus voltae]|uniref:Glycerophosphoryl diester phosphodiesterase membrane domain-containing protein n=1 Tax=Methanococcus voltae (strain ATCC BAA-1334 / A3) TaxID=456320 RepID=D7DUL1_METV3|nr:DUF4013 domain-containing protein [Methanococcus voltae]MCS3900622.1 hypothetical protein [Methanococcus voltae]